MKRIVSVKMISGVVRVGVGICVFMKFKEGFRFRLIFFVYFLFYLDLCEGVFCFVIFVWFFCSLVLFLFLVL